MAWAYFCWRDGGGLVISSLSLPADVAGCSGGRIFGGLAVVGQNDRGGWPRRCYGGLMTGGKGILPPRKEIAPIWSSGRTLTGAKSKFKADSYGALLCYSKRVASVKSLHSDLVVFLKIFFSGTKSTVRSDLPGALPQIRIAGALVEDFYVQI
ncbi:hypothetical protein NDU88_003686 [Pleurodeles waltl]|uniref:Uncharacterized protein n=1 Tax=Pleurodeles waltl TaxID=8319 RepID=A0AAV7W609_PLEWA|nr:hypothetical protein NDU88_003686 [Pleurodeles waltl]